MKEIKRAIHFDLHTMPGIEDFGSDFNADEFAGKLYEANVGYVNFFARCNIGFSYYDTKTGTKYPFLKSNMCTDVMKALKNKGIGVTLYLNGGLNHELMLKNPGIMKIDKQGRAYNEPDADMNFFRTPCFNSGYREYLLEEIREILQMQPDGIFVDCMIPRGCYCPRCVEKMKSLGIDITNDDEVYAYAVGLLKDVMKEIRETVPYDKHLYINSFPYDDIHDYESHAELECLPTDPGEWGYDYIAASAPYYRMFEGQRVYMTGCFVTSWGEFGAKKTKAAIENDVYDALLYGYSPSVGDHLHPTGKINSRLYRDIKDIYGFVKRLEPWTDGSSAVCDVAVLRNKITCKRSDKAITDSDKGAARMMSELKICFDIINEDMPFDGYKLIVLPDNIRITDKLRGKLESFNGSILSSGESFEKGGVWDYFEAYDDENTDGYYEYKNEIFNLYSPAVKMKSDYGIAGYTEPYFRRGFDGSHAYFYNPPKKSEGFCAAAVKDGKAHVCFNAFEAYINSGAIHIKGFIRDIIDALLPDRLISADDLPSGARVSLMRKKECDILHIKTTYPEHRGAKGIIEEHIVLPEGRRIRILGEYKSAKMIPENKEIEFAVKDGYTELILPQITGYGAFELLKQK